MSQRRACRLVGQPRSTQRRPRQTVNLEEEKLRRRLREIAAEHIRWGRRKAYDLLRREGFRVNHKRVQRLWREEGLQRPQPAKRKRARTAPDEVKRLRAAYRGHVWAMDFQFSAAPAGHDETADGRRLKFLNVVDEFTRQALAIRVGRHCSAAGVIDVLEELLLVNGAPTFIRMDNGPEFIAKALVAWCSASGSATAYIPPGSPWENPFVESFNGRFRDEFLNTELFFSLKEAQVLAEAWRREYNDYRPHSSLGGQTPTDFAQEWAVNQKLS